MSAHTDPHRPINPRPIYPSHPLFKRKKKKTWAPKAERGWTLWSRLETSVSFPKLCQVKGSGSALMDRGAALPSHLHSTLKRKSPRSRHKSDAQTRWSLCNEHKMSFQSQKKKKTSVQFILVNQFFCFPRCFCIQIALLQYHWWTVERLKYSQTVSHTAQFSFDIFTP